MMACQSEGDIDPPVVIDQPHSNLKPSGPITIRHLRDNKEDTEFVGRLSVEAFREKYVHATSEGSVPDMIRYNTYQHQGQHEIFYIRHFIAEYEGHPVGILALKISGDPDDRSVDSYKMATVGCADACGIACFESGTKETVPEGMCYLDTLAVEKDFRGKGVGKALINRAEQEARQCGCEKLYLHVVSDNEARHLYERQGFVETERTCRCGYTWCAMGKCVLVHMEKEL